MTNNNHASLETMRGELRDGSLRGAALRARLEDCASRSRSGYDDLDEFVSDLLLDEPVPEPRRTLEPGMVQYQPTPIRVVLALLDHAHVDKDDVFFDIGSGLGQVPILVHLLTGATAVGVEFEPAYCGYARQRALDLNLDRVIFRNEDARAADYHDGTVFFLYTPATGEMLQELLERIRRHTSARQIRVLTYGPCTEAVAALRWLAPTGPAAADLESIGSFVSSGPAQGIANCVRP
jgi:SAM-dependent methyltransferase